MKHLILFTVVRRKIKLVWKDTKEDGVVIGKCKDGGIVIVASYYPAGNFIGKYPF